MIPTVDFPAKVVIGTKETLPPVSPEQAARLEFMQREAAFRARRSATARRLDLEFSTGVGRSWRARNAKGVVRLWYRLLGY